MSFLFWFVLAMSADAAPQQLRFAFFAPDTESTWVTTLKPFIDAVNAEGKDVIEIQPFPNGALGRNLAQQLQLIQDGVGDITFMVLGLVPGRFPDNGAFELPGLFNDINEAARVVHALVASGKLRGYSEYFPIAVVGAAPSLVHVSFSASTFKEFSGKKIRATNATEADSLRALGAASVLLPVSEAAEAIARGTIDGTTMQAAPAKEFGITRVTRTHYAARVGSAVLAVLMTRAKFDSLSPQAQAILKKYSGEWIIKKYVEGVGKANDAVLKELEGDPQHKVIIPEGQELGQLTSVFKTVQDAWKAKDPRNPEVYALVQAELAKLRGSQ